MWCGVCLFDEVGWYDWIWRRRCYVVFDFGYESCDCLFCQGLEVLFDCCEWRLEVGCIWNVVEVDYVYVFWNVVFCFCELLQYFECYLIVGVEYGGGCSESGFCGEIGIGVLVVVYDFGVYYVCCVECGILVLFVFVCCEGVDGVGEVMYGWVVEFEQVSGCGYCIVVVIVVYGDEVFFGGCVYYDEVQVVGWLCFWYQG